MIRGTTAQFRFEMPKSFEELCTIEVIFGQEGNAGTIEAPLPITKIYNRGYIKVKEWNSNDKNTQKIYFDGEVYYKYENGKWVETSTVDIDARNDGISTDPNNHKILLVNLNPEETMRFSSKRKGYLQVIAYCDTDDIKIASLDQRFNIYPIRAGVGEPSFTNPSVYVLDAGQI